MLIQILNKADHKLISQVVVLHNRLQKKQQISETTIVFPNYDEKTGKYFRKKREYKYK